MSIGANMFGGEPPWVIEQRMQEQQRMMNQMIGQGLAQQAYYNQASGQAQAPQREAPKPEAKPHENKLLLLED